MYKKPTKKTATMKFQVVKISGCGYTLHILRGRKYYVNFEIKM